MIRAKKKEELTIDSILKRVTEYDIYRYYLGRDFQLGTSINSPFREDRNPSFFLGSRGGFIHHTDLKHKELSGNCVQLVEQLYSINYHEALQRIDVDLSLGISKGEKSEFKRVWKAPQERAMEELSHKLIQVHSREFDSADRAYWNQFYITPQECKAENVFAVKDFWVNKIKMTLKPTELCYAYLYDDKWKIYFPHRGKGDWKWFSNVPMRTMDGLEALVKCPIGLIVKSKKEKMVAKKFLSSCTAAVQNESSGAISEENILYLQENVNNLFLIFDNDKAGVEASIYYNQFGFGYWNVPQSYRKDNIKDIAELIQQYGPDVLRAEISKKIQL